MDKMILVTLRAIKSAGFKINRELLDNVNTCIARMESNEKPVEPKKVKEPEASQEKPVLVKEIVPSKKKHTKEELEDMKYWDIRKEYNITGEKSMKKDELIEMILAQ